MADTEEEKPGTITFHLIKSPAFRTVHADGVWGGVTPRGFINMGFYSERAPFPRQTTYPLMPDGQLGDEIKEVRVQRDGPVRELEFNATIDLRLAKSLITWLKQKIKAIEVKQKGKESV